MFNLIKIKIFITLLLESLLNISIRNLNTHVDFERICKVYAYNIFLTLSAPNISLLNRNIYI